MFPWRRKPSAPADVRPVALDADVTRDPSHTRIVRPDVLSPVAHSLPRLDPHAADLRGLVTQVVEALHAQGGLDEFTLDALDDWITQQHTTWLGRVDDETERRRFTAATLVAQHRQNAARARKEHTIARMHVAECDLERRRARADLGLPQVAATTPQTTEDEAAPHERSALAQELGLTSPEPHGPGAAAPGSSPYPTPLIARGEA